MGNNCCKDSSKTAHTDLPRTTHSPRERDYVVQSKTRKDILVVDMPKRRSPNNEDDIPQDNADNDGQKKKKPKYTAAETIELDQMNEKNKQEPTHSKEGIDSNNSDVSLNEINVNDNDQGPMKDPKAKVEVKQEEAEKRKPQPTEKETRKKIKNLEKDLEDKTNEVKDLQRRLEETQKGLEKELTEKDEELTKVRSKLDAAKQKLENTKYRGIETVTCSHDAIKRENMISKHDRQRENEIARLKAELTESNREREELLTRLSALAGARLLNNNPNIADLSDSNRPTKLAEQYSELYDNQWTDAYTALEKIGLSENECIKLLLDILINTYQICKDKADVQYKALEDSVSEFLQGSVFPAEMIKHLKESRKTNYKTYIPQLQQDVYSKLKTLGQMTERRLEATVDFRVESLTLCWLMCIQDPPVYIDCNVNLRGKKLEKGSFKEYTKSGPIIEFVVWPTVYLHRDGPMLIKGVAQGTASKDDLNTPRKSVERNKKGEGLSQSLYTPTHSSKANVDTSLKRRTMPGDPSKATNDIDQRPHSMLTHVTKDEETKPPDAMPTHIKNKASTDKKIVSTDKKGDSTDMKQASKDVKVVSTDMKEVSSGMKEASADMKEASTNTKDASTEMREASKYMKEVSTGVKEASKDMKETSTAMTKTSTDMDEDKSTKSCPTRKNERDYVGTSTPKMSDVYSAEDLEKQTGPDSKENPISHRKATATNKKSTKLTVGNPSALRIAVQKL